MKELLGVTSGLATLFWATTALSDVIPPEEWVCNYLDPGAPCSDTVREVPAGVCSTAICSRLDYSQAGFGHSVEYECLRCVPTDPDTPATGGTSGVVDAGVDADAALPDADEDPEPSTASCSCRVAGDPSRSGPPGGLLLSLGVMSLLRRRRTTTTA
ncbi:MAG: hypothetical protein JW751_25230 [Polyangiaceae bacterium]|nr:hypothetical protein [Polyangiaceae bacterium]